MIINPQDKKDLYLMKMEEQNGKCRQCLSSIYPVCLVPWNNRILVENAYVHVNWGGKRERLLVATLDHIVPVSRGGTWYFKNLQLLCWFCNQAKADKL